MKLLTPHQLTSSPIAANTRMNRERNASGVNSYEKEIALSPLPFLKERALHQQQVRWLDLCCGTGKALIQTAKELHAHNAETTIEIYGVDLVGFFEPSWEAHPNLSLIESTLTAYETTAAFDLITCIHGMHYIGDKLGIIKKYIGKLKQDGIFICNLDTKDIFDMEGNRINRQVNAEFKRQGLDYDAAKRVLRCRGSGELDLPFSYKGADDTYGKNYTGQETVSSYYT
ncbi:MAG: class I SAM-dependent methyltransferase [bacterium]|nr:class I SAM-dependent methyltransferase [bacterium]